MGYALKTWELVDIYIFLNGVWRDDGRDKEIKWRDCVGIEPTGDCTSLPGGFEDLEGHQFPIQSRRYYLYFYYK